MNYKGEIFTMFINSNLSRWLTKNFKTRMDGVIYMRFFRTGLIGQEIFDLSLIKSKSLKIDRKEKLSALSELYIFYMRMNYDYLIGMLKKGSVKKLPDSFSKFSKNYNNYNISDDLKESLKKGGIDFSDLKNLRDSIKQKSSVVSLYLYKEKIKIKACVYSSNGKFSKIIDKPLAEFIFSTSFMFWYFSMMIYMEIHGKTWQTLNK